MEVEISSSQKDSIPDQVTVLRTKRKNQESLMEKNDPVCGINKSVDDKKTGESCMVDENSLNPIEVENPEEVNHESKRKKHKSEGENNNCDDANKCGENCIANETKSNSIEDKCSGVVECKIKNNKPGKRDRAYLRLSRQQKLSSGDGIEVNGVSAAENGTNLLGGSSVNTSPDLVGCAAANGCSELHGTERMEENICKQHSCNDTNNLDVSTLETACGSNFKACSSKKLDGTEETVVTEESVVTKSDIHSVLNIEHVESGFSCTSDAIVPRELELPIKKKLLVLDINGLLADINTDYGSSMYADFKISGKFVFKRPFCAEFLNFCFANFEIGVWSSRKKYNVEKAVEYLMGNLRNKLLFCWDQSKCTATNFNTIDNSHKPLVLKELIKLWEKEEPDLPWEKGQFSPSNTLLVDDSPYKALCNPPFTAIFPPPYSFKHREDNSLGIGGDLRVYLEKLATAEHVQYYVKDNPFGQPAITDSHPNWKYYLRIIENLDKPLVSA